MENSKTSRWRKRLKDLRDDQSSWRAHWKEIVDYFLPRYGRYLQGDNSSQHNDGSKKHQKIINGSGKWALGIMASGLQGGLTSPSRPWFTLSLPDEELAEYEPVRRWLHDVRNAMLLVFSRSNFYGSMKHVYVEDAGFGTAAMMIEEDYQTVIRCRPFTIGEYCLSLDCRYRPDSLYRQFAMTAMQMLQKFGKENLPVEVRVALENNKPDQRFEVVNVIERSDYVNPSKADYRGMQYASVYFPYNGSDENFILKRSGYNSIPFIAPRWDVIGIDTYGVSPAMDALADEKMLQKMEQKKLKKLDKNVDPPMNAPTSMKHTGGTIVAGGVNFVDVNQGQQGFSPTFQTDSNIGEISAEIQNVMNRIRSDFAVDLFLAVTSADKDMTATEVAKRYEEKLMVLGPVFERLQSEAMDPIIDRVFSIMNNMGMLPPPPRELPPGMELKVEYISLLAQAQKMVETTAIQQFVGFTAEMAKVNQDVLDKVDFDETVDQMGQMLGVPPKIVRSDDKVQEVRAQRMQMQRAMQMAEAAQPIANSVKALGSTPVRGGESTALDALTGQ